VPFAAPCDSLFSVSFGENRRSDSVPQRRLCALIGHWWHESERRPSAKETDLRGMGRAHLIYNIANEIMSRLNFSDMRSILDTIGNC
jgi:hypothetical protein